MKKNKEIVILFIKLQQLFSCFRKSNKFTNLFKEEVVNEISVKKQKLLKKQQAFWYDYGGTKYYFEPTKLEILEELKEKTSIKIASSNKKMAQLLEESKNIISTQFEEFFMFNSQVKDLLSLNEIQSPHECATEILIQLINTTMYNQINQVFFGKTDGINISFVTFSQNLGEILMLFILQSKVLYKISSIDDKLDYLQTCSETYLQNIYKNIEYKDEKIASNFFQSFDITPCNINPIIINTLHLYLLYTVSYECHKNKESTNFNIHIKIITKIFTPLSKNNNPEQLLKVITTKLRNLMKKQYVLLGTELLKPLITDEKIFILRSQRVKGSLKKTRTEILLKIPYLNLTMTSRLPIIARIPYRLENNQLTANLSARINYVIKCKSKQLIHNNYYLTGITHNEDIFKKQREQTKFKINSIFTFEFFSFLGELAEKAYDYKTRGTLNSNLTMFELLDERDFNFLLELYNIDFKTIYNNKKTKLINDLLLYALDFNNLEKFRLNTSIISSKYALFYQDLIKKIYSYKIIFSELFCHVDIMRHFKEFQYNMFFDARGRKSDEASALNPQGFPLARCFLSFSNNLSFEELIEISALSDNAEIFHFKEKILLYLRNQLSSVMDTENIDSLSFISLTEWFDNIKNLKIKQNSAFLAFTLFYDYYHFKTDTTNKFRPLSHYSLDSSTSGIQLTSIITKDKILATCCNVCDPIQSEVNDLKETINSVKLQQNSMIDVAKDIARKNKGKFHDLIEYHNAINQSIELTDTINLMKNQITFLEERISSPSTIDINTLFTQDLTNFLEVIKRLCSLNFVGKSFIIKIIINKPEFSVKEKYVYFKRIIRILQRKFYNKSLEDIGLLQSDIDSVLEYKFLLSKTFLKVVMPKHESGSSFTKKHIIAFLIMEYILDINNRLNTNKIIESFILSRKIAKILNMTIPYGSTQYGRTIQFKTQFIKFCLSKGYLYTKEILNILTKVTTFIDRIFINWLNNTMPQTLYLFEITKKLTRNKQWESFTITSPLFEFIYYPEKKVDKKIATGLKKKNTIRHVVMKSTLSGVIDYKKIQNSFVANLIQFCDALLCSLFFKRLQEIYPGCVIPSFSIFDRFFIDPLFSFILKNELTAAYKGLYSLNILENNFNEQKFPSFYKELHRLFGNSDKLKETDINHYHIAKH